MASPVFQNAEFVRRCFPTARIEISAPGDIRIKAAFSQDEGQFDWLLGQGASEQAAWEAAAALLVKDGWCITDDPIDNQSHVGQPEQIAGPINGATVSDPPRTAQPPIKGVARFQARCSCGANNWLAADYGFGSGIGWQCIACGIEDGAHPRGGLPERDRTEEDP